MLQNLFDVLCTAVMAPENKERFVAAEGLELMLLMMKSKKQGLTLVHFLAQLKRFLC